jgi:hypothetical protein
MHTPGERPTGDGGFTTAGHLLAVVLAMVAAVGLVNFVAVQYGKGVLRAAVDEAARAGSRVTGTEAICEAHIAATLDDLLSGPLIAGVSYDCTDHGDRVAATVTATFPAWVDPVPDLTVTASATAVKEHRP